MDAWNTEKFIRAYAQTKKFDSKEDTKFNSAKMVNKSLLQPQNLIAKIFPGPTN